MFSLLLTRILYRLSRAHSWVEQVQAIDTQGRYVGSFGYPRGYVPRSSPLFSDAKMTYRLPSQNSGTKTNGKDAVCAPSQRYMNYTEAYPALRTQQNVYISMKYLENGHVTLPDIPLGKPPRGGTVSVYATTNPSHNELLGDVLTWNNTQSLITGRLLARQTFDDHRCYQINPASSLSQQRQKAFPNPVSGQKGSVHEQWCEVNVRIPPEVGSGQVLAIYWIWQWPTLALIDPNAPDGKDEIYTSCLDFQIGTPSNNSAPLQDQDPQTRAITNFSQRANFIIPDVTV